MQYLIENYSKRPYINCIGIVMKFGLLGSNILFGSSDSFHDDFLCTKSEVCQFDEWECLSWQIFGFEQNIFGFQIAMRYTVIVKFLNTFTDLQNTFKSFLFVHAIVFAEVEHIPASINKYQRDPPEQYSVIYQTASCYSMIS